MAGLQLFLLGSVGWLFFMISQIMESTPKSRLPRGINGIFLPQETSSWLAFTYTSSLSSFQFYQSASRDSNANKCPGYQCYCDFCRFPIPQQSQSQNLTNEVQFNQGMSQTISRKMKQYMQAGNVLRKSSKPGGKNKN